MDTHVHLNAVRLGVRENPYQLLKRTFGMGYDGVLYLEDDVALSPDAVELVLDFVQHGDIGRHRSLCLYNTNSREDADPAAVETGHSAEKFSPWVFFTTAAHWANFFAPTWHTSPKGWDWSITATGTANQVALPALSRTHHIGRFGGVHYVAKHHDHLFANNPYWQGEAPSAYVYREATS